MLSMVSFFPYDMTCFTEVVESGSMSLIVLRGGDKRVMLDTRENSINTILSNAVL